MASEEVDTTASVNAARQRSTLSYLSALDVYEARHAYFKRKRSRSRVRPEDSQPSLLPPLPTDLSPAPAPTGVDSTRFATLETTVNALSSQMSALPGLQQNFAQMTSLLSFWMGQGSVFQTAPPPGFPAPLQNRRRSRKDRCSGSSQHHWAGTASRTLIFDRHRPLLRTPRGVSRVSRPWRPPTRVGCHLNIRARRPRDELRSEAPQGRRLGHQF
jgi:hypothetical protein